MVTNDASSANCITSANVVDDSANVNGNEENLPEEPCQNPPSEKSKEDKTIHNEGEESPKNSATEPRITNRPRKKYPLRKKKEPSRSDEVVNPEMTRNKHKKELLRKAGIVTENDQQVVEVIVTRNGKEVVVAEESADKGVDREKGDPVDDEVGDKGDDDDDYIPPANNRNGRENSSKLTEGDEESENELVQKVKSKRKKKDIMFKSAKLVKGQEKQANANRKVRKSTKKKKTSGSGDSLQVSNPDEEMTMEEPRTSKPRARKPRECDVCKRVFANFGSLKEHKRIHSGEKPFVCPICGIGCIRRGYLKQHVYEHTGEWPFKCVACGKGFINQSRIQRHMRVHSDDRPFICDTCGEGFKEPHHLTRHFLLHTGEKPFKCELCPDRYFLQPGNLKIHMKTHQNGGKPKRSRVLDEPSFTSATNEGVAERSCQGFKELTVQNKAKCQNNTFLMAQELLFIPKDTTIADQGLKTTPDVGPQNKDKHGNALFAAQELIFIPKETLGTSLELRTADVRDELLSNNETEVSAHKDGQSVLSPSKQESTSVVSSQNKSRTVNPINLGYTIALPLQNTIGTATNQSLPLTGSLTFADSGNTNGINQDRNTNVVQILGNIDLANVSGLQNLETLSSSEDILNEGSQNAYVIAQQLSSAEDGSVIALQLNPEEASAIAQIFINSQQ